jgi:hypothetical protein
MTRLRKAVSVAYRAAQAVFTATWARRSDIIECAGVFSVLTGIAQWSVPCALIIGGLAAVGAIEYRDAVVSKLVRR